MTLDPATPTDRAAQAGGAGRPTPPLPSDFVLRGRLLRGLRDASGVAVACHVTFQLAAAVLPAATALATATVIGRVTSHASGTGAFSAVLPPLLVLGAAITAAQLTSAASRLSADRIRTRINAVHRQRLALLVSGTPTIADVERPEVQDRIRAASGEPTSWMEKTPGDGAVSLVNTLVGFVGIIASAVVLSRYSWWLVPVIVAPALVGRHIAAVQLLRHLRIWRGGLGEHRQYWYWGRIATSAAEGKETRVFGLGDWIQARSHRHIHAHMDPVWADHRVAVRAKWQFCVLTFFPMLAAFLSVGLGTAHGHGSLADETLVLTSAWTVFAAVSRAASPFDFEGVLPGMRALYELERDFATPGTPVPSAASAPPAPEPRTKQSDRPTLVRFEGVGFSYPGLSSPVLRDLDLEIRPGELLALVGLNGAGKSTLTKILAGLYEPTSGRLTADGVDIHDIGAMRWRSQLAVVFQDFVRYPLSARQNVIVGRGSPDGRGADALLAQVAADSGFDQVLERLPNGWDTPLTTTRRGGVNLSGGQWQQVVLARALYAVRTGAGLLVLDEPTAHLDVRTEFDVFRRLAAAAGEAGVVLISHRLSTVRRADRIVLLEGGRITESGDHDELMALGGRYAEMFETQAQRFRSGYDDRLAEGDSR
jgi:ATP-binding cassette subfamily B protein